MSKISTQVNSHSPYLVNLINKLEAEDATWIKVEQNGWTQEAICEPSLTRAHLLSPSSLSCRYTV